MQESHKSTYLVLPLKASIAFCPVQSSLVFSTANIWQWDAEIGQPGTTSSVVSGDHQELVTYSL